MNKLLSLFLTVACAFLVSIAGTTVAVARPSEGYSPIYSFDVMDKGRFVVGEVKLNTAHEDPTYALVADGLTPNANYMFGYSLGQPGDMHTLGTEDTSKDGKLRMKGTIPLEDIERVPPSVTLEFWVTETPPGAYYEEIVGLRLFNWGWVIGELQAYYSKDGGATWQKSSSTDSIWRLENDYVDLGDLGIPEGALVKIHVIVKAASDKTGSEVFTFRRSLPLGFKNETYAAYEVYGTAFKPKLQYWGLYEPGEQCP